jgi:hypothetical protein
MIEFTETFWLTVLATGAGILGLIIKKISSSKCDEISCFGVHIHRRVELEKDDIETQESKTNL